MSVYIFYKLYTSDRQLCVQTASLGASVFFSMAGCTLVTQIGSSGYALEQNPHVPHLICIVSLRLKGVGVQQSTVCSTISLTCFAGMW